MTTTGDVTAQACAVVDIATPMHIRMMALGLGTVCLVIGAVDWGEVRERVKSNCIC